MKNWLSLALIALLTACATQGFTVQESQALSQFNYRVKQNWLGLEYPEHGGESAVVALEVEPNGSLKSVKIIRGSSNKFVDESLMFAVRKAAPLQIPPGSYEKFKSLQLTFRTSH